MDAVIVFTKHFFKYWLVYNPKMRNNTYYAWKNAVIFQNPYY